ncbi:dienelactone hydrolase [Glaciihabitans arcticus]|uniref:Dienelactone hydrolase n=1 Tax=Glaciihabitans arcticus TaxID=2668039 RepID=A0A4Q9GSV9_9MICO|nr:alpha/beta fold hydrolase [Glaciihabitans arcticus]TBN58102.1 dienelactone hydrolase [Glaciihabitans arcticus]
MVDLVPVPSPGVPLYYGTPGDPLVIVLHDWHGRLPWLEGYANGLVHAGFRVAVPDLYGGWCATSEEQAAVLRSELEVAPSLAILDEIVQASRTEGSQKVGAVGSSMGGWLALQYAQRGEVDAVVAYYATLGPAEQGVIPNPVLLHFAETDQWDAGADPAAFVSRLKEDGTPVTEHNYIGTVHGFANASIPKVDTRAAALAFARTASFLQDHLG